uniref:Reverse transcriptase domain-containing protein n=1 Tax=Cyprinus carpio TaxID=7962 RepID=A0A8C1RWH7_CYPCA
SGTRSNAGHLLTEPTLTLSISPILCGCILTSFTLAVFTLDTNSATDTLCSTLSSCLDNFCPLSSRPARTTPSAPWLSDVLREHRSKLRAAERKWLKSRNSTDLSVYQSLLSSFSANVFTAKTSYYHDKINNCCDARTLFKTFSSLLNPPPPPPQSTLTADDFAVFFTNKTRTISDQFSTPQTEDNFTTTNAHSFSSFSPLSETDVSKLILSSHPTTCPLDPIPTHLLQAISSSVIPSLTHIINSSLHSGTFPSAFKQARVSPLLKKPSLNPALLENYRPVSLLPFIAKTLERAVFNQLSMFLVQNNLLDSNQSGFKSGHSTETALLSVTEALRLARAASKSSVLILLDLSAAFDTVNHQILLSTLRKMGISGTALQWLNSYLSDRSFRVSWRGEVSKSQQLATGVPQGSVLGPLLFSIYMTSLGSVIQKHGFSYHCYADDTQLYFSLQPDDPTVAKLMRPPEACVLQVNDALCCHPKEGQNHSHRLFPGLLPAGGMTSRSQFEQLSLYSFSKNI